VKVYDFFVGIPVFLGINTVMILPAVSMPMESGAMSRRITS